MKLLGLFVVELLALTVLYFVRMKGNVTFGRWLLVSLVVCGTTIGILLIACRFGICY